MKNIEIHGREGFTSTVSNFINGAQIDISDAVVYFEIPAAKLRLLLPVDETDAKSLRATLTREQVETLPTAPAAYTMVDETSALPVVIAQGTIRRYGYTGAPS